MALQALAIEDSLTTFCLSGTSAEADEVNLPRFKTSARHYYRVVDANLIVVAITREG